MIVSPGGRALGGRWGGQERNWGDPPRCLFIAPAIALRLASPAWFLRGGLLAQCGAGLQSRAFWVEPEVGSRANGHTTRGEGRVKPGGNAKGCLTHTGWELLAGVKIMVVVHPESFLQAGARKANGPVNLHVSGALLVVEGLFPSQVH